MWREVLPALGDDVELTLALVALINRDQKPASIFRLHSSSRRWLAPPLLVSLLCSRSHKIAGDP